MEKERSFFVMRSIELAVAICAVALPAIRCPAVTTVSVSPSTYTLGDVATPVVVQANTAAPGNTLVFDVYIDVDGDKSIDPEDWRFSSFEIADGQAPYLGNPGFWHDEDGTKNSSVKATLIANGAWPLSGHFIIKVTDKNASTAKTTFTVEQDGSHPCVVTGEVRLGASPARGAIVWMMDMATEADVTMGVAGLDGKFVLRVDLPGQFAAFAIGLGAVSKDEQGSAQIVNVAAGSNSLSQPLLLFTGDHKISGKVLRADTSEGFRGVLVSDDAEGLFAVAVTGDDGTYNLAVVDGEWEGVSTMEEQISRFGYIGPALPPVTVSGSDVTGIDLSCPRATTLITGTVKDAATLQGLQGYQVYAEVPAPEEGATALVYTGADGSYAIGVVAGEWKVYLEEEIVYENGYAPPQEQQVTAPGSGTVSGIDFLLQKAGTITGHVYEDDGVTPIEGADVQAFEFGTWNWVTGAETGSDGSYKLWVPSGTYMVRVSEVEGWVDEYYLNATSSQQATPVVVAAPGKTSGIDFILVPAAYISGHVYEDDGTTPIGGARVEAFVFGTWDWVMTDETAADGSYRLKVPAGTFMVRVVGVAGWLTQYYDRASSETGAKPVNATAGQQTSGIDFVLQPAATIVGHVYQDDGITPVEGAQVSVAIFGTWNWVTGDRTKSDGSYRVEVPPGTFMVVVSNICGSLTQFYNRKRFFPDASPVSATAGQETSGIDFVLEPAATITGHIYQADGITPIAGADVRAFDEFGNTFFANVVTGNDGLYCIAVPGGSYRVWADAGDRWVAEYYDDAHSLNDATVITLVVPEQKSGIDFALTEATATIEGHVYQQDETTPIAGAQVYARDHVTEDFVGGTESGPDGSYTLHVSPGTFTVWAWKHHWNLQYYDHEVSSGDATPVTVSALQVAHNIDFALEWIPFVVQTMSRSSQWPGCIEVRWAWVPGMGYSVYWTEELDGTDTIWHEVPDSDKDIVKEGTGSGFMTWIDKGTSPGMNGNRPGDPIVRQRFYKVKEEPE